jgi:hypothetical protein
MAGGRGGAWHTWQLLIRRCSTNCLAYIQGYRLLHIPLRTQPFFFFGYFLFIYNLLYKIRVLSKYNKRY